MERIGKRNQLQGKGKPFTCNILSKVSLFCCISLCACDPVILCLTSSSTLMRPYPSLSTTTSFPRRIYSHLSSTISSFQVVLVLFQFVYKLKDLSSTDSFSGNCVQTAAHPSCLASLPSTCGAVNINMKSHSHIPEVFIVVQL